MEVLRTPEEHLENLPGFDFEPRFLEVDDDEGGKLRVHYLDEGPKDAPVVLMLHGLPTWSFLYRKMIPVFVDAGVRAVAPDYPGFGRSDKPADRSDYSYARHVAWMRLVIEQLDLEGMTLFAQDWGGLIGLRLVAEMPEDRFSRIVASNTFMPTGDQPLGEAFYRWREFTQSAERWEIGRSVNGGCVTELPGEVVAGYDAPFPDQRYQEGCRAFPALVPAEPDDPAAPANRRAWEVLAAWEKPVLTLFGDSDPITRGADKIIRSLIPGAQGQPHQTIEGAGHFIQEDKGQEVARLTVEFLEATE